MDYPLSFGVGQQGGFTGNPMPPQSYQSGTPTLGTFQGNGMGQGQQLGLAQAIGSLFGGMGGAPAQMPAMQHIAPQAMVGPGAQSRPQMLAAALNRFQGV